jgi:hypothetical protein
MEYMSKKERSHVLPRAIIEVETGSLDCYTPTMKTARSSRTLAFISLTTRSFSTLKIEQRLPLNVWHLSTKQHGVATEKTVV